MGRPPFTSPVERPADKARREDSFSGVTDTSGTIASGVSEHVIVGSTSPPIVVNRADISYRNGNVPDDPNAVEIVIETMVGGAWGARASAPASGMPWRPGAVTAGTDIRLVIHNNDANSIDYRANLNWRRI